MCESVALPRKIGQYTLNTRKIGDAKAYRTGDEVDERSARLLPSRCEWRRISETIGSRDVYEANSAHFMRIASRTTKSKSAFRAYYGEEIDCVSGRNGLASGRARHINTEALNQNCDVHR